jgi:hypothetical protein
LGNDWVTSKDKGTVYDSDVTSDADAIKYYGEGAKRLKENKEYEDPNGKKFTLFAGSRDYGADWKDNEGNVHNAPNQRYEGSNFQNRQSWLAKGDDWVNTHAPKFLYKTFGEYNPVAQITTNFWSSVTGTDMTIPSWSSSYKNASGQHLSATRRVSTGVVAVTGFLSLAWGGGSAFMSDFTVNLSGDMFGNGNNFSTMNAKNATSEMFAIKSLLEMRRNPLQATKSAYIMLSISLGNSYINNGATAVDGDLKEKEAKEETK